LDTTTRDWLSAQWHCNNLSIGGRLGWRLPTLQELASLNDWTTGLYGGLPNGHPFAVQPQEGRWWSASTYQDNTAYWAYAVWVDGGMPTTVQKTHSEYNYTWCVRGGMAANPQ
jgi:hypothetical protein